MLTSVEFQPSSQLVFQPDHALHYIENSAEKRANNELKILSSAPFAAFNVEMSCILQRKTVSRVQYKKNQVNFDGNKEETHLFLLTNEPMVII